MFSKMKIGDFADLNSISVQTLRYYEKVGLILPVYIDPATKYRYYHLNQSASVDIIQFLKGVEFSLTEIKELLEESEDLLHLEELIQEKQKRLVLEKQEIEDRLNSLDMFQKTMIEYKRNQHKEVMEIKRFPKRYVLTYPINRNIYSMSELEYEYYLREFKQYTVEKGYSRADFSRIGSIIKREDFIGKNFFSQELFMFVTAKQRPSASIKEIPAGNYAVYYCQSFAEEINSLHKFNQLIEEQGLQVMGDYICEVIYEVPKLNVNQRNMFIRMQLPVTPITHGII